MLSQVQFSVLYPTLALFAKEKGWRCGKSFISWRSKCYTNPKTGQKLGYKYEINPKTGRRRKVRVGLNYKEYQKARTKALKKRGQGKKLTTLEQKYIADTQRLATSTRKKKQRAVDAKNKRKAKASPKDVLQDFYNKLNKVDISDLKEQKEVQRGLSPDAYRSAMRGQGGRKGARGGAYGIPYSGKTIKTIYKVPNLNKLSKEDRDEYVRLDNAQRETYAKAHKAGWQDHDSAMTVVYGRDPDNFEQSLKYQQNILKTIQSKKQSFQPTPKQANSSENPSFKYLQKYWLNDKEIKKGDNEPATNKTLEQVQKEADAAREKNAELIARARASQKYNPGQASIPQYLRSMNNDLSKSLDKKLKEFDRLGIPAFTILETEGERKKQTLFALNKKGEATVYRSQEKPRYDGTNGANYDWVESKYLHSNKQRKTLAKRTTSSFTPKADQLDRIAYNESFRKSKTKEFTELKAKQTAIAKQKELEELARKADSRQRSGFIDYLESAAKSLKGKKGEIEAPVSVPNEKTGKRETKRLKGEATLYGANGEFAYHPSFSKIEAAAGVKVLTHVKTGAQIYKPESQKEARQMVYQILNSDANLDVDDPKKFTSNDLNEISNAVYSVKNLKVPDNFDPDNPPEIRNFNPQKKSRSKKKVIEYKPSKIKYQDLNEGNQIFYDEAKKKIKGFDDDRVLATVEAIASLDKETLNKGVPLHYLAEAIQYEYGGGVKKSTSSDSDRIKKITQILDSTTNEKTGRSKKKTSEELTRAELTDKELKEINQRYVTYSQDLIFVRFSALYPNLARFA